MQEKPATALSDFLHRLRGAASSVLLLDYDGTLAPFHKERHLAYPYPGIVPLLTRLFECDRTRVILITGRPVEEVQRLLHPLERLEIWGAHGLEHLLPDGSRLQVSIAPEADALLSQGGAALRDAGFHSLMETKAGGIAAHWRGLPENETERVQARVIEQWTALAEHPELKLLKFDGGLELRLAHPDKGDAVSAVLHGLDPNTPVAFLGDDLTDEDAFHALHGRGLTALVRSEYRNTAAEIWLKPPHELLDFMKQWLDRVSSPIQ